MAGVGLLAALRPALAASEIAIGTGSEAGVYYQVGRAICRLVNAGAKEHGLRCTAVPTAGSIFNLDSLRMGLSSFGVAQSDWHFHAYTGSRRFADAGADLALRSVFSVHAEPFTIVARRDAGIRRLQDLKGRRVNVGNPGSGQRATMEVVMRELGWVMEDFALANDLPASQQSLALCHDRIDAMIYTVGHPNASVAQAAGLCDAIVASAEGPEIDKLVAENPFYSYSDVPGGTYPGNPDAVTTFGVRATVVTSASVDSDVVYALVKAVFETLDGFKKMHPAFGGLDAKSMIREGLTAPLHDGAERYYREVGLL